MNESAWDEKGEGSEASVWDAGKAESFGCVRNEERGVRDRGTCREE